MSRHRAAVERRQLAALPTVRGLPEAYGLSDLSPYWLEPELDLPLGEPHPRERALRTACGDGQPSDGERAAYFPLVQGVIQAYLEGMLRNGYGLRKLREPKRQDGGVSATGARVDRASAGGGSS